MFKINDYIMYGRTGLCKVMDIIEEEFGDDDDKRCYVLEPVYSKNMIIKTPVSNKKIMMRRIHSREEISELLHTMSNKKVLWIDNDKERDKKFKDMVKTGDCGELIAVVKSIHGNRKIRKSEGKKLNKGDDEIMKKAEQLINEEFSIALGIEPEEVPEYILNHVPQ